MTPDVKLFNKFDAGQEELEHFLFFSVAVAGKQAETVNAAVDRFFCRIGSPLQQVMALLRAGWLIAALKEARLGQYRKLARFCRWWAAQGSIDLKNVSLEALESAPGIGPKTSRFFLLYTRRHARYAVLDTHVLAWLGEHGHAVPRSTPQNPKRYREIELIFLEICDELGLVPQELDNTVWQSRTRSYKKARDG